MIIIIIAIHVHVYVLDYNIEFTVGILYSLVSIYIYHAIHVIISIRDIFLNEVYTWSHGIEEENVFTH